MELEDIVGPELGHAGDQRPWPLGLSDEELGQEEQFVAGGVTAGQLRYAQERAGGATVLGACRKAGLSARHATPYRLDRRPEVQRLIAILREQARRRAAITIDGQIARFQDLGRKAEEAGELGVAVNAEVQASKLAGLLKNDSSLIVNAAPQQIVVVTGVPPRDPQPALVGDASQRTLAAQGYSAMQNLLGDHRG
jgi:hypothetical protein